MRDRQLRAFLLLLAALIGFSREASAVQMDWVSVGAPGNACDPWYSSCFGAVAYTYQISRYEVTNAQYAEFLNAVAAADPNALYHTGMSAAYGGITRAGSSGSYSYGVIAGRGATPVNFVSFQDTIRFANWLQNGQPIGAQGIGTTGSGGYTVTAAGIAANSITRNPGATIVLASENEWYKAAYYSAATTSYFDYPTGSNTPPTCGAPSGAANRANCDNIVADLTNVGSYPGSPSPFGTYDQGGNAWEWNETIVSGAYRVIQGGSFGNSASWTGYLGLGLTPTYEDPYVGFRVASIPEPSTGALFAAGLAALALRRRRHR